MNIREAIESLTERGFDITPTEDGYFILVPPVKYEEALFEYVGTDEEWDRAMGRN